MREYEIEVDVTATVRETWSVMAPDDSTASDLLEIIAEGDASAIELLGEDIVGNEEDREFVRTIRS